MLRVLFYLLYAKFIVMQNKLNLVFTPKHQ